ncbi:MAG: class I SAM-dependent methyltransferase [Saprospiraceae bacterium]|nr:class I SAM-dependent methyltransferase [Saprospiraceae bacterium]
MYEFHGNKSAYFEIQRWVTANYIIPFLSLPADKKLHVLEIGCGEAGVLKEFLDLGHYGTGIELSPTRVELAKRFLDQEIAEGRAAIINSNIYDIDPNTQEGLKFDLIVLKDVIEHIPDQEKFIHELHDFLLPGGRVFFAYPPWWMPFGGHQQICNSRVLSKLPWIHLLPKSWYKTLLHWAGESEATIHELLDIKETGLIAEDLYTTLSKTGFSVNKQQFWIINPIYVRKFRLKPLASLINIPYLRNIYCTAHYIVFS